VFSAIQEFKTLPFVGVSEPGAERPTVRCVPNPAGTECRLELSGFNGVSVPVSLQDNLGRKVMFLEIPLLPAGTTSYRLDLNSLAEGIYHIGISLDTEVLSIKLVHYSP
jgi:hypothetical protein